MLFPEPRGREVPSSFGYSMCPNTPKSTPICCGRMLLHTVRKFLSRLVPHVYNLNTEPHPCSSQVSVRCGCRLCINSQSSLGLTERAEKEGLPELALFSRAPLTLPHLPFLNHVFPGQQSNFPTAQLCRATLWLLAYGIKSM